MPPDRGFAIDTEVFTALMTRQRTRSREGRRRTGVDDRQNDYQQLLAEHALTAGWVCPAFQFEW